MGESFLRWIIRHRTGVAAASLLVALVGAYCTVQLYGNLRTDLEELLPRNARSVLDLEHARGRLESSSNLAILVFSAHPAESRRFVDDLARVAATRLPGLVSRVEYRIDRELEFFRRRRALFLEVPHLIQVREYVRDRIRFEREIRNPLNIYSGRVLPVPKLDIGRLTGSYARRLADYTRFPRGYYATPDERIRVLLVYLAGKASGIEQARRLRAGIDRLIAELRPESYAPDLRIHYTGDVENLVEEDASVRRDLLQSALVVLFLVTLAMVLFYRSLAGTVALVLSCLVGTLAAFAVSYRVVGYLNANSAFLGSIVLGNGINFGIIVLARYLEERRRGGAHEESLLAAGRGTARATLAAALGAGLAYGSLIATDFRGFRQFGIIALFGMVFCWASAFVSLPAFLSLAEDFRPFGRGRPEGSHFYTRALAAGVVRFPRLILAATALTVGLATLTMLRHREPLLEPDTSKLRDRASMEQGAGHYSRILDRVFKRYLSPVLLLPANREGARRIARRLRARQTAEGRGTLIAGVLTLDDFVPREQPRKLEILHEIRSLLRPSLLRRLDARDRRRIADFLTPETFRAFGLRDLPPPLVARFREAGGAVGRLVLVEPVLSPALQTGGEEQTRFVRELREAADAVEPGTPVVGQFPLTVDLRDSILRDGPRSTTVALAAVGLLIVAVFRRREPITLVLGSLLVGIGCFTGGILGANLRVNFLNFVALPITIGIGVDYGVNIVQRYRLEGPGSVRTVLQRTGGAVTLASLTTIIGYGSLLMAGNQGFVSFGRIAILGEFTCLLAAVLSLPAFLEWRDQRGKRPQSRKPARAEPAVPAARPAKAA